MMNRESERSEMEERVLGNIEKERQDIIKFLQDLVRIPSPVGEERDVQMFIADKLKAMGLKLDIWEPEVDVVKKYPDFMTYKVLEEKGFKNRPVVVGIFKGIGGGKSLMLQGHTDVMPAGNGEWIHNPWSGVIEGDRIHGRGTYDMKGGVAAMIMAGHNQDDFYKATKGLNENVFVNAAWFRTLNIPKVKSLNKTFHDRFGRDISDVEALAYVTAVVALDALERVGSTDRPKIREALTKTNRYPKNSENVLPYVLKFDETGQVVSAPTCFAQVKNDEPVAIYPLEYAAAKPVWPAYK